MTSGASVAGAGALSLLVLSVGLFALGNPGGALFTFVLCLFCVGGVLKAVAGDDGPETAVDDATDRVGTDDEAVRTLRERYARGELSDEEFERKLAALEESRSTPRARARR